MQLLEVKNDIAKIIYNPAENHLLPSDFLLIEDVNQKLISQIINISTTENSDNNVADVRLSLSIDKEDNLSFYNGYIPSKSSNVIYINPDEIMELIKGGSDNIYVGCLINHSDCFVKPSVSFVDDRLYIQSDRDDKTKTVVQNIISELFTKQKKVILLDFDGRYNSITNVPRLKISESFKLPLNIDAFNNILEYDTTDCPIEDKAVIQSIVLELREYLKTLENKFLPFTLFKNVIDNEFMANPISGLMLLRNKLWLYAQESIFAESKSQFDIVNTIMDKQNLLIIDASSLEEKWYKFAIQTIINLVYKNCYFVLSLNDVPMDKKAILSLYNKNNIIPVVSTSFDSKYRAILKSICKNQLLLKPSKVIEEEEPYAPFLSKMNSGELIIYGESTLFLPLILELQSFDSSTNDEVIQNEIKKDVDKLLSSPKKLLPDETVISEENLKPVLTDSDNEVLIEEDLVDDDFNDADLDFLEEQNQQQITIEEIRQKKQELPQQENQYDIFDPLELQDNDEIINVNDMDDVLEEVSSSEQVINEKEKITSPDKVKEEEVEVVSLNDSDNTEIDSILESIRPMGIDNSDYIETESEKVQDDKQDDLLIESSLQEDVLQSEELIAPTIEEEANIEAADEELLNLSEEKTNVIDDVINNITSQEKEEDSASETEKEENNQEAENSDENFVVELEDDEENNIEPPSADIDINSNKSPDLTVYDAEIPSNGAAPDLPFKIGDRVYHPKHGNGVIEGFANYSNKIFFCQIEFENVGRRILDPRISGLQKIS